MPWFFWPRVTTSSATFHAAWTTESHPIVLVTFLAEMLKNTAHQTVGAELVKGDGRDRLRQHRDGPRDD